MSKLDMGDVFVAMGHLEEFLHYGVQDKRQWSYVDTQVRMVKDALDELPEQRSKAEERQGSLLDTKALLIRMRQYIVRHRLPIGECVAWNHLKEMYGLGKDWEAEDQWLREYEERHGASIDSMPVRPVNEEE